jgi:purine-cytosine permease-like protein
VLVPGLQSFESILALVIGSILAGMATKLISLLGGGSKHRQDRDIRQAIARWIDYRQRKGSAHAADS